MTRLRALSFPRRSSKSSDSMASSPAFASPYAHSRDSSGASSLLSSPVTSTFSNRSHGRWPSSSSSLVTTPESPPTAPKSALHDLLEDPSEREDELDDENMSDAVDQSIEEEPFCICDTTFCEHRRADSHRYSAAQPLPTPEHEWTAADDYFFDDCTPEPSIKRRKSGEHNLADNLTRRLSRRFPSISKRWRDPNATSSPAASVLNSAPVSRSSSLRRPTPQRSFMGHTEPTPSPTASYFANPDDSTEENLFVRPRASSKTLPQPLDVKLPEEPEEPIDRQALSSTPLLPPMMTSRHQQDAPIEELASPLEAPTIADPNSSRGTPISSPVIPGYVTPPLSAKNSNASIHPARPSTVLYNSADATSSPLPDNMDPWADKLGHANFHIFPEPYMPDQCDAAACKRLLEDWETARREYMRQAVRTGEHHGPTSHIYKLTEQKWDEIDAQWRSYHDSANAIAQASGEQTTSQTLAHTQRLSKMPSLNDPRQPAKFPRIDDADIVGPMVKYAEIQRRPSRKATLLRIFTDPSSLLAGRSSIAGLKRRL